MNKQTQKRYTVCLALEPKNLVSNLWHMVNFYAQVKQKDVTTMPMDSRNDLEAAGANKVY